MAGGHYQAAYGGEGPAPVLDPIPPVGRRRRPVIAERTSFERIVGEQLPAELFTIVPWGHRMIVVRERPIETTPGGVVIPKTAQRELETGWVVSIGDRVGLEDSFAATYPGLSPFSPPETLIGTRVTFGKYAGAPLFPRRDTIGGTGYESRFVILTDGDVFFHHHEAAAVPQESTP